MAKKKVNTADLTGKPEVVGVEKFYCYQKKYAFFIPKLDEEGNPVYTTDAYGNNKTPVSIRYEFKEVPVYDELTKKVKPNDPLSVFVVEANEPNRQRLIDKLNQDIQNKHTKVVSEDTYLRNKNPEAYRIAEVKAEVTSAYEERIKALEERVRQAEKGK
jgi:hypothetical protein